MALSILSLQTWDIWASKGLWYPNIFVPRCSKQGNLLTQPGFITGRLHPSFDISSGFISLWAQTAAPKFMPSEAFVSERSFPFRSNSGCCVDLGLFPSLCLKAVLCPEVCPQPLISWITVITQMLSNNGLCRGFSVTLFTACELKQEWLYLSKEEIGKVLGFICGLGFFLLLFLFLIESTLHVHSSPCTQMAFATQAVAPCIGNKAGSVVQQFSFINYLNGVAMSAAHWAG